jgi:integrase
MQSRATSEGTLLDRNNVAMAFRRALRAAALPHHSPHGLRHTFASLLLQDGVSLADVQRMVGHADPRLTATLYGKWLPVENPGGRWTGWMTRCRPGRLPPLSCDPRGRVVAKR